MRREGRIELGSEGGRERDGQMDRKREKGRSGREDAVFYEKGG